MYRQVNPTCFYLRLMSLFHVYGLSLTLSNKADSLNENHTKLYLLCPFLTSYHKKLEDTSMINTLKCLTNVHMMTLIILTKISCMFPLFFPAFYWLHWIYLNSVESGCTAGS